MRKLFLGLCSIVCLFVVSGCESPELSGLRAEQLAQRNRIGQEPPGDYYIGRRYYNPSYKFWGYLRRPGQPWHSAQLVMLNEKQKLAPDREANQIGADENCEYRIYGKFTGDTVYEPASNHVYPEFLLTGYELIDKNPPSIFPPGAPPPTSSTEIDRPD